MAKKPSLKLSGPAITLLMGEMCVSGDRCHSKAMRELVNKGLYRDSGDAHPLFMRTIQGETVRDAINALIDKGVL